MSTPHRNNDGTNDQDNIDNISYRNSLETFSGPDERDALLNSTSSDRGSHVGSSTRSTASSTGGGYLSFSSHWLDRAAAKSKQDKDSFRNEQEHAVEKGIVQAAFLIRDAVLGESENPSKGTYDPYMHPGNPIINLVSLIFRQILSYRLLRQFLYGSTWALALLTFVEPPRWCRIPSKGDNCQALFSLQGPPAIIANETAVMADEVVDYYPNSRSLFLSTSQSTCLELSLVSFVSLIILLRIGRDGCSLTRYLRHGPAQLVRLFQVVAVVLIYIGLWTQRFYFQPFARLLLLGTLLQSLHHEVAIAFLVVRMNGA